MDLLPTPLPPEQRREPSSDTYIHRPKYSFVHFSILQRPKMIFLILSKLLTSSEPVVLQLCFKNRELVHIMSNPCIRHNSITLF